MSSASQRERVFEHMQDVYSAEPEYLWMKYPNSAVFRHPMSRKWFALMMDIPRSKLGLPGEEIAYVLVIKCDPLLIGALLSEPGFFPAYHMNKSQWVSVLLDGPVPDERILPLLAMSYDAVSLKRK